LDLYSHVVPSLQREAAKEMGAALFGWAATDYLSNLRHEPGVVSALELGEHLPPAADRRARHRAQPKSWLRSGHCRPNAPP